MPSSSDPDTSGRDSVASSMRSVRPMKPQPNPYTANDPLVVRDHPLRDNRSIVISAALVLLACILLIGVRVATGEQPLFDGQTKLLTFVGVPLSIVLFLFAFRLSSGIELTLTDTTLHRRLKRRDDSSVTVALHEIDLGLYVSEVRYAKKRTGREIILFLPDQAILWIADGIADDDMHRIAQALSSYRMQEYLAPIANDGLRVVVRKLRRAPRG